MSRVGNRAWFASSVGLVVVALSAASCDQQQADTRDQQAQDILARVRSQCDDHGNRVYVNVGNGGALAVVGSDPTCQTTVTR